MKKKFFTEKRIELLIRFWAAGSVYFFLGWGTGLGLGSILDFIFLLGIVMAVVEMFIVNPIIKHMLNVKTSAGYLDTSVLSKVKYRLIYILKTIFLMTVVAAVYSLLNIAAIIIFSLPENTVAVPGEPILFGVLYVAAHQLLERLTNNIKEKMKV